MGQRFIVVRTTANKAHPAPPANRPNVKFPTHEDSGERGARSLEPERSAFALRVEVASLAPLVSPYGLPAAGSPARPSAPVVGVTRGHAARAVAGVTTEEDAGLL